MRTNKLFSRDEPVVINGLSSKCTPKKKRVKITRPTIFSNPFPCGSFLDFTLICSKCSVASGYPVVVNDLGHFVKINEILDKAGGRIASISRSEAISAFKCYWSYIRNHNVVTDEDILALRDTELVCCCKPKACHGDVIVADYRATKKRAGY